MATTANTRITAIEMGITNVNAAIPMTGTRISRTCSVA